MGVSLLGVLGIPLVIGYLWITIDAKFRDISVESAKKKLEKGILSNGNAAQR